MWPTLSLKLLMLQGDFDEDGSQGSRFRGKPLEPYTKPLADE